MSNEKLGVATEDFTAKRVEWLRMLNGDPIHSISRQVTEILWNDAVFRNLFYHPLRVATQHRLNTAWKNRLISGFIERAYVEFQSVRIRRLIDPRANQPNRQVISLRRLVVELLESRALLTRQNYVNRAGTEEETNRLHALFDRLSGQRPTDRTPDDTVRDSVLDRLLDRINGSKFNRFKDLTDKYIAHAADETSRRTVDEPTLGFSLERFSEVHREVMRITNFVSGILLHDANSVFIPMIQFDPLENLDKEVIPEGRIDELHDILDHYYETVAAWSQTGYEDFWPE